MLAGGPAAEVDLTTLVGRRAVPGAGLGVYGESLRAVRSVAGWGVRPAWPRELRGGPCPAPACYLVVQVPLVLFPDTPIVATRGAEAARSPCYAVRAAAPSCSRPDRYGGRRCCRSPPPGCKELQRGWRPAGAAAPSACARRLQRSSQPQLAQVARANQPIAAGPGQRTQGARAGRAG